ncbi:MAG: response regulator [Candidatus Hermodarchaeota archaeon]
MNNDSLNKKKYKCDSLKEPIRILHVDDHPGFLYLTRRYLELISNGNLIIDSLSDSTYVLNQLKEKKYDLIVSDYLMPEMTGLELLRVLRKQNNDILFIMFTGSDKDVIAKALNSGADYYIKKESSRNLFIKLEETIRMLVTQKRKEQMMKETDRKFCRLIDISRDENGCVDSK